MMLMDTSETPDAAVAVVQAMCPEESVLLIRRSHRADDPWSGHWSFPGGRFQKGDSDLLDTALRELYEEVGVRLERGQLSSALAPRHAGQHYGRLIMVAPYLFRLNDTCPTLIDEREAAEALWFPLALLRDPSSHKRNVVPGLPGGRKVSGIELNGAPLWGFTYRVLCEWQGVLMPDGA
jgi:8-oxo-dGTP pyrophosphatase MutT (NUDIX family)